MQCLLANQILTSKYKMHPKYAFLKHLYGKTYSFEVAYLTIYSRAP